MNCPSRRARNLCVLVLFGVGLILFWEILLRSRGIIDFPLYDVDARIGYIPKPGQQGVYLNKYAWSVNEKNQTAGRWSPKQKPDLLLVGDSIVWGGIDCDQQDKLGPQLQKRMPNWSVWAAGASGWSVLNEMEYLDRNPEVVEASEVIVWMLNSEDFAPLAVFATDQPTPRQKPASACLYVLRRDVLPKSLKQAGRQLLESLWPSPAATAASESNAEDRPRDRLSSLCQNGKKIVLVMYPAAEEWANRGNPSSGAAQNYHSFLEKLYGFNIPGLRIVDGMGIAGWSGEMYADTIHPTGEGVRVLASWMANELEKIGKEKRGAADAGAEDRHRFKPDKRRGK